jgi:hypothetical protein
VFIKIQAQFHYIFYIQIVIATNIIHAFIDTGTIASVRNMGSQLNSDKTKKTHQDQYQYR